MTLKGRQIGIVDDDASVGKALQRLLRAMGVSSRHFHSGEEFLADADVAQFDCLILDVTMPDMDGFSLKAHLDRRGIQTPVIFITALEGPEVLMKATANGHAAFLRKPFEANSLLEILRNILN